MASDPGYLKLLANVEFPRLRILLGASALAVGAVLAVLSTYEVHGLSPFSLVRVPLSIPLFAVAGVLVALGVLLIWQSHPNGAPLGLFAGAASVKIDGGRASAQIGQCELAVTLGRIEALTADPAATLVVLPANEYFNDRCFNDSRSALGAFVKARFPGRARELEALLVSRLELASSQAAHFEGRAARAYGLGTAVFLDDPLASGHRLLFAAATTERQGEGLKGDAAALFQIARKAHVTARDNRIAEIVCPVIGSGHGSLNPAQALLLQLMAWCELLYAQPGQRLRVRIVVFQASETAKPDIDVARIRDLMYIASSLCAPTSPS